MSVFVFFLWGWFLVSVPCGQRKCLIWFKVSRICWGLLCVLSCGLSLKMFHVHLKRMCILLLWDEKLYIYQLSPFPLGYCELTQYLCWYFVWKVCLFLTVGVKIPYYNCVGVNQYLSWSPPRFSLCIWVLLCWVHIYLQCLCLLGGFFLCLLWSDHLVLSLWPFFWSLFCLIWVLLPWPFFPVRLLGKFVSSPLLAICVGLLSSGGSLVGSICVGHIFLSIQLFYFFWLEHLILLSLRLLSIGSYSLPFFPTCVPLSFSFPSFP